MIGGGGAVSDHNSLAWRSEAAQAEKRPILLFGKFTKFFESNAYALTALARCDRHQSRRPAKHVGEGRAL
jgi:hypothetical protein